MNQSLKSPRGLAFLGLMLGITIILDISPLGVIPLGAISATIIHIPTIITGITMGPLAGLIMGTSLGIVGFIHAVTRPMTVLDPLFANPLVSVLPRMFIGVVAYLVYAGLRKLIKNGKLSLSVSSFLGGIAGSMTNTALVFLMLYLVYAQEVVDRLDTPFQAILLTVFTTNAIAEALISAVITLPVAAAYFRYQKSKRVA